MPGNRDSESEGLSSQNGSVLTVMRFSEPIFRPKNGGHCRADLYLAGKGDQRDEVRSQGIVLPVGNLSRAGATTARHAPAVRQLPLRCSCARKKAQRGSRAMRWQGKTEARFHPQRRGRSCSQPGQHQPPPAGETISECSRLKGLKEARRLSSPERKRRARSGRTRRVGSYPLNKTADSLTAGLEW